LPSEIQFYYQVSIIVPHEFIVIPALRYDGDLSVIKRGRMMLCESFYSAHQVWRCIMKMKGDEIHVSTEEARGAVTRHGVRYVLLISLVLAIIALSAIWMTGTLRG
jgi:hypothetical protein